MKAKLFFATNRKHEGSNRWSPDTYGERFSSDGHENLRFGELDLDCDEAEIRTYLERDFKEARTGDGEGLASYLAKCSKKAQITAYEDYTAKATEFIAHHDNSSTRFFKNLKSEMHRNTDVLVYIHGYNVSWDDAVGSALSLQMMLNRDKGPHDKQVMVVLFSWPSNGSMMPFAAYKSDRSDARDSGKAVGRALLKLKDFLGTLSSDASGDDERLCGQHMHLLCHSMGNYLLQNALQSKVIGYTRGSILPRVFKNIFLCAADVNDDVLEPEKNMGRLHEMATTVTVYYNHGDTAMYLSKYTKHLNERLGHAGNAHPAMVHNKIHQVDCSQIVHGFVEHSYYLWADVNADIRQTVDGWHQGDERRKRKSNGQNREWTMI